jgi:WD40 repeat protein
MLAASCHPDSVFVWNREAGQLHGTFGKRQQIHGLWALTFSPDGKTLAMGFQNKGAIRLWDLATWKELTPAASLTSQASCLSFSPDGKALARTQLDGISLWEPTTGKVLRRFQEPSERVESMAFAADGRTFVSAEYRHDGYQGGISGVPCVIRSWDVTTGKEQRRFRVEERGAGLSPDASLASFISLDGKIQLWDVPNGKMLHVLQLEAKALFDLHASFSAGGKGLATISGSSVAFWESAGGKQVASFKDVFPGPVFGPIAFSQDHGVLAVSDGKKIHVWSRTAEKIVLTIQEPKLGTKVLRFSPDGKVLASGGNRTVRLWDVGTGKELCVLEGHRGNLVALAFSPDGKLLASGSDDTTTLVWDVKEVLKKK